jgi:hypothetical protein
LEWKDDEYSQKRSKGKMEKQLKIIHEQNSVGSEIMAIEEHEKKDE